MSELRVAARYAKSLLELAQEKGLLEEIHADMKLFSKMCQQNHDLALMLKNPIINHHKKRTILYKVFEKKVHPPTLTFFDIITRKNRERYLPLIAAEFDNLYNQHKGIDKVNITTTFPLTDDLRKQFENTITKLTGRKLVITEKIDPSLIGGYVIKIGDQQIDDSVKSKLTELSYEFKDDSYVKAI